MNPFIWTIENSIPEKFCENIIRKFEIDTRTDPGQVGKGIVQPDIKLSTDLNISIYSDWEKEDRFFHNSLSSCIDMYSKHLSKSVPNPNIFYGNNIVDSGYQIQRTKPGEFYNWHNDFFMENSSVRVLTYIWYLNTISDGGYTEFWDGTKIQPKVGKFLMFPSTWNYIHRGVSPIFETKYICTGWVYSSK